MAMPTRIYASLAAFIAVPQPEPASQAALNTS